MRRHGCAIIRGGTASLSAALILPIIAILLFTPRLGVLTIPEVVVFAGMAGWLCCEQHASE